ncbi:amidohydrolase [Thalassospira sp. HJ]|uniref:amidohydrolase family protein n=1 Tax=Thalassospira sp. HJ TaxID=1616823 RepID=UPI0005CDED21|nr:amidohydrolase [Thalassospira sp. HJ]KJE34696.1 amidohydrolase [Thalassospira sp. HJ]
MFIDTHLHLVARDRITYPWLKDVPALDRDWTFENYETTAKRIGIQGVLHMEVDCAPNDIATENAFIGELMAKPNSLLLGAVSSARPESKDCETFLERLDLAIVKGIRRVLHVVPDELSQSNLFRENVRKIGNMGLPFDICVLQRQIPLACELVDACPDTVFVLDHCGVPDIAGDGFDDWERSITTLSERPNVNVKISGISAYAKPDWTIDTLRPYFEHIIECFGWNRVVWGSDSPVCTLNSSLDQWMATTQALIEGTSTSERAAFASENAKRIWSL